MKEENAEGVWLYYYAFKFISRLSYQRIQHNTYMTLNSIDLQKISMQGIPPLAPLSYLNQVQ